MKKSRSLATCLPGLTRIIVVCLILALLLPPAARVQAAPGEIDETFLNFGITGPDADTDVNVAIVQSGGKVVIGGTFLKMQGASHHNLARLNSDGSLDTSFNAYVLSKPGSYSTVYTITAQPDGKLLVGGDFIKVNSSTENRHKIARLNADGTLDTSFNDVTFADDDIVNTILVLPSGKILIGGDITQVNGVTRKNIALLNSDGTLDSTSMPALVQIVSQVGLRAMALQPDGKIVIAGMFSGIADAAGQNPVNAKYLARLNTNGSLDTAFTTNLGGGLNSYVHAIALQSDGKILLGGEFVSIDYQSRRRIARLNSDGSLDAAFMSGTQTGANGAIYAISLNSSSKILVAGAFTSINGAPRGSIALLNSDGSVDNAFMNSFTGADALVKSAVLQSDGKPILTGRFTSLNGDPRSGIARLNTDGSTDTTFRSAGANAEVDVVLPTPGGQILVGGRFDRFNGSTAYNLVRLNADGSLDPYFSSPFLESDYPNAINTLALQPNGLLLIGGKFSKVHTYNRRGLVRLDQSGLLDTTFLSDANTGADGEVFALAVQPDEKVLVAGNFPTVNGVSRPHLARLNKNGSLDTAFLNGLVGPDSYVYALALQPDGKIVIAGNFKNVNGAPCNYLARLNADGSLDAAFNTHLGTGPSNVVRSLALQPDGKVLLGGWFTQVSSVNRNRVARLNADGSLDAGFMAAQTGPDNGVRSLTLQANGKVIIGGEFTHVSGEPRGHIARLNQDGTLDINFILGGSGTNKNWINSVAVQADQKILLGGDFSRAYTYERGRVARLLSESLLYLPMVTN